MMQEPRKKLIIGTFPLEDLNGKLERENLKITADKTTICGYEGKCEIRYERDIEDPRYVHVSCCWLRENK